MMKQGRDLGICNAIIPVDILAWVAARSVLLNDGLEGVAEVHGCREAAGFIL
jgi:hypothetical protein